MSSMLLNPEHFNSVEQGLKGLLLDKNFYFREPITDLFPSLRGSKIPLASRERTISAIMDEIRKLSVLCFYLQYKEKYVGTLDKKIDEYTDILMSMKDKYIKLNLLGLHKAAFCIEYQIETEHLERIRPLTRSENNAYIFIKNVQHDIARHIVEQLEDYDKQKYSI